MYASPEVVQSWVDHAAIPAYPSADIWALGVIMWEALTHRAAFARFAPKSDVIAAAAGTALYPWEAATLDAPFARSRIRLAVEACLQRDAAARPSAAELVSMIDRLANKTESAVGNHASDSTDGAGSGHGGPD